MSLFLKPKRRVRRIFLHCSATDATGPDYEGEGLVRTIKRWHTAPKKPGGRGGRGWSDIGYHFLIDKAGRLMKGRNLEKNPIAQRGHNRATIAICCHGLAGAKFTEYQRATLTELCVGINHAYGGHVSFHGHREVAAKACPVFDYRVWLDLDRYGNLGGSSFIEQAPGLLREGDNGPAVTELQQRLNITADGVFGPATKRAVLAFQRRMGLEPDCIVGPRTRRVLFS